MTSPYPPDPPGHEHVPGDHPLQPYQPQPGYQQPAPGTNVLAVVSLILSLVWICGLGSIAAVVIGVVALNQIKRTGEQGRVLAIVGIVLGIIGLLLVLAVLLGPVLISLGN